jgi:hypothetical protein
LQAALAVDPQACGETMIIVRRLLRDRDMMARTVKKLKPQIKTEIYPILA